MVSETPNNFQSLIDATDFWRHEIGANVIPADTKNKTTSIRWTDYQDNPIADEQHNRWKKNNAFNCGIAIILGRVWHNPQKANLYINAIDCDNESAIREICNYRGSQISVQQLSNWTIVEQHKDAPDKMHVIVYSTRPFLTKSSNKNNPNLVSAMVDNEVPAIEVKSTKTMLFVSPSLHRGGQRYEILGTMVPVICDEFEKHVDNILRKYGIPYLGADNGKGKSEIPIKELYKPDFEIYEGQNRHEAVLRIMESLISRNGNVMPLEDIKTMAHLWNQKHCRPPLNAVEFDKQWKCAVSYIVRRRYDERFGEGEDGKLTCPNSTLGYVDLVDELKEKFHLRTVKTGKEIYYYNAARGIYLSHGNILIESELEAKYLKELEEFKRSTAGLAEEGIKIQELRPPKPLTRKAIDEFIGHVERRTYIDISELDSDIDWIACKDCMINLGTGKTAQFDPKFLSTIQIPVRYNTVDRNSVTDFWHYCASDPVVDLSPCPKIMKFLDEIMSPEDVALVLDFMAYCLWRHHKFHVWMLLNGAGQNGKSTLLTLFERFFGPQNISGESLDRLLTERFAPANLYQKLMNVDADLSGDILLHNTGKLKKLTGNDEFPAEFKYKPPFKFRNHAKLVFSCNEIPECNDKTDAFFRRLIIINFPRQFLGDKEDLNLIDKLTTEEEFSGLLYELLRRLPRVLEKGIRPTTNKTMEETYDKFVRGSNPVQYFVEKAITSGDEKIPKEILYESYCWFCREKNLPIESEQSFSRKLSKDFGFRSKQVRMNGTKTYCWENIRFIDWKVSEDKSQETLEEIGFTQAEKEALK